MELILGMLAAIGFFAVLGGIFFGVMWVSDRFAEQELNKLVSERHERTLDRLEGQVEALSDLVNKGADSKIAHNDALIKLMRDFGAHVEWVQRCMGSMDGEIAKHQSMFVGHREVDTIIENQVKAVAKDVAVLKAKGYNPTSGKVEEPITLPTAA